jgi:hypothetical protein
VNTGTPSISKNKIVVMPNKKDMTKTATRGRQAKDKEGKKERERERERSNTSGGKRN